MWDGDEVLNLTNITRSQSPRPVLSPAVRRDSKLNIITQPPEFILSHRVGLAVSYPCWT